MPLYPFIIFLGTALPNFLLWSKIFQLPPFLRIFEILERTKKGKGGSTKKGGSWGVRFLVKTKKVVVFILVVKMTELW